jgi:hypothetical protein
VLHLEDAGAAAIVMHSLFEEDVRNDERMIDRFLVNPNVFGEATGHLPFGDDYQSKLDGYLENIQQLKSRLGIPVIASLNGCSLSGWVELGKEMQEAGADALELNAWFMPGDPKVSGGALEDNYLALLRELKAAVNLPISMKLSPFFSSLPHFVQQAEIAGAAGVSLFNRFFQPDIDLETLRVVDRVQLSSSADTLAHHALDRHPARAYSLDASCHRRRAHGGRCPENAARRCRCRASGQRGFAAWPTGIERSPERYRALDGSTGIRFGSAAQRLDEPAKPARSERFCAGGLPECTEFVYAAAGCSLLSCCSALSPAKAGGQPPPVA